MRRTIVDTLIISAGFITATTFAILVSPVLGFAISALTSIYVMNVLHDLRKRADKAEAAQYRAEHRAMLIDGVNTMLMRVLTKRQQSKDVVIDAEDVQ